jgi:hypothetical protein
VTAHRVEIGWQDPETEAEYRIVLSVTPGHPGRTYGPPEKCFPPEGPEVEVLSVREDRPGGAERPDLVARVDDTLDPGEVVDGLDDEPAPWPEAEPWEDADGFEADGRD